MTVDDFGVEQTTDEDRAYRGSRYADVRAAIRANPYREVWGRPGDLPLPMFPVTFASIAREMLSRSHYYFLHAAERTVDSHADLRWGPDPLGFRRLLHPNGVCLFGRWQITADTPYT